MKDMGVKLFVLIYHITDFNLTDFYDKISKIVNKEFTIVYQEKIETIEISTTLKSIKDLLLFLNMCPLNKNSNNNNYKICHWPWALITDVGQQN